MTPMPPTRPWGQSYVHHVRAHDTHKPVAEFAELPDHEQERIEGRDPTTGERDGARDGRITVAVPIRGPHRPFAPEEPSTEFLLATQARHASSLVIASDLDDALRKGVE